MAAALSERLYIWDRFVRLHHWSLVALVLADQFVLEGPAHRWAGYTALCLVCARLVWGFIGSRHARFADFFPGRARWQRVHAQPGTATRGHNPLGALMVLALLALVMSLGASGWLMRTDAYWGETWLEDLHAMLANALLIGASVHVVGVIATSIRWRINLPRAMVTGYKQRTARSAPFAHEPAPRD